MADVCSRDNALKAIHKAYAFAKDIKWETPLDTVVSKRKVLKNMWERYQRFHTEVMERSGPAEISNQDAGYEDALESFCNAETLLEDFINQHMVFIEFSSTSQIIKDQVNISKDSAPNAEEQVIATQIKTLKEQFNCLNGLFTKCINSGISQKSMHEHIKSAQENFVLASANWEQGAKRFIPVAENNAQGAVAPAPPQEPVLHEFKVNPVSIPKFLGLSENWEAFRDLFRRGIHERRDMSNVVKFQHLKASLGGEAEIIIRNIPISDDNYETAWALLLRHYDNIPALIKTHLRNLFTQSKCKGCASDIGSLLSKSVSSIQALNNLGCPTIHWDDIMVYHITELLDDESTKLWEQMQSTLEVRATWASLETFLYSRVRALTSLGQVYLKSTSTKQSKATVHSHQAASTSTSHVCTDCNSQGHRINYCHIFRRRKVSDRINIVASKQLCQNCLSSGHNQNTCPSDKRCLKCGSNHNTLLHSEFTSVSPPDNVIVTYTPTSAYPKSNYRVLLATALVQIKIRDQTITLRALLDQGSQTSFITESSSLRLQLPKTKVNVSITGLAASHAGKSTSSVQLLLGSIHDKSTAVPVNALVLHKLTTLPMIDISIKQWPHIEGLQLADPSFFNQDKIDLLLGADVYGHLLLDGLRLGPTGSPVAQRTVFGWILSGPISAPAPHTTIHCNLIIEEELRKFWELEEVCQQRTQTKDEIACERFYADTHRRDSNGRFIVRLPFNTPQPSLGDSYKAAAMRMYSMERRFARDPQFHSQYKEFIAQYIALNHMEPVPDHQIKIPMSYYIPHHAVMKESSSTTKLRVVFDASRKTSNGRALNEQMFVGPRMQQELFSIILRWRKHKVVFTTDVEKMFRQILVNPLDRDFQRILWRNSATDPLQVYRLTTVTYGTSSAPYLAIKTLRQLAENEREKYPKGSETVLRDAYVDDILSGSFDLDSALEIQAQLIKLLDSGGFVLKKWTSNNEELLSHLPVEHCECSIPLSFNLDNNIKTLGIEWSPVADMFSFSVTLTHNSETVTKRILLSDASKLYDPLGWLAPSVVLAKIMFQHLWTLKLDWDDQLPADLTTEWLSFKQGLTGLRKVKIYRWVHTSPEMKQCEIHGFCDASMKAYAAVVYIRVTHPDGSISTSLLTSKSKVAPLKTLSLPKLELCGAVLLSRLLESVVSSMEVENVNTFAWTDSQIVLCWLKSTPSRWNVFVANRVAEIQGASQATLWQHVISDENPADLPSRGIHPTILHEQNLWWEGPKWLRSSEWPPQTEINETNEEERCHFVKSLQTNIVISSDFRNLVERHSDWMSLLRIQSYVLRFCFNTRHSRTHRRIGLPDMSELQAARLTLSRASQLEDYASEIAALKHCKNVQGKLASLCPFRQ